MKRIAKILCVLCAISTLLFCSNVVAFAAENISVNGVNGKIGDTFTYDLRLGDVAEKVEGIQMNIYYDTAMLELKSDTVDFEIIKDAVCNTEIGAIIKFNASNLAGYDFSKEKSLVKMDFKALKAGSTEVSYYIEELYDVKEDDVDDYIKKYTLKSDISVNGETTKDLVPVVNQNVNTGKFINNENGLGKENGGNGGDDKVAANGVTQAQTTVAQTDENGNTIETEETVVVTDASGQTVTDEFGNPKTETLSAQKTRTALITGGVVVLVVAIILVIVLKILLDKKKKSAGSSENDINNKE